MRLASRSRSPNSSSAVRRRKIRFSQYSTCAKNSWCQQPASRRSWAEKKGINRRSHLWAQPRRSLAVKESAIFLEGDRVATLAKGIGGLRKTDTGLFHL